MTPTPTTLGSVVSLWRYPVKSMMGEELNSSNVTKLGLFKDRSYAIVDRSDGKVASAKNPRKWPRMFEFRAALTDTSEGVRITLPDGTIITGNHPDINQILSDVLERDVMLSGIESVANGATAEEYWPDIEGLDHRDTVTDFGMPQSTFFDAAQVHLLTTATLDRLRSLHPAGRFEVRRFRPNVIVEPPAGASGFVENDWVGQQVAIGDKVRLKVTAPCFRCVMTTLAQGDLPKDTDILRTAAQHNRARVGVYANVVEGGQIRRGDSVRFV